MTAPSTPLSGMVFVEKTGQLAHLAVRFLLELWNRGTSRQLSFSSVALKDAATINWDLETAQVAQVTLTASRTIAAPTNMVNGGKYTLSVIQGGTGSYTLTWNAVFKWPASTAPTLTTTVGKRDIINFVSDGTYLYGKADLNF
jgi:hypothetical protein